MGPEDNKALVRRFWDELIIGGNVDVADELLAPNYQNLISEGLPPSGAAATADAQPGPEGGDVATLKAAVVSFLAAVKDLRFEVLAMAAEDDAVFARVNVVATLPDGTSATSRGLAYYRIADGKIVMNDLMSVPT